MQKRGELQKGFILTVIILLAVAFVISTLSDSSGYAVKRTDHVITLPSSTTVLRSPNIKIEGNLCGCETTHTDPYKICSSGDKLKSIITFNNCRTSRYLKICLNNERSSCSFTFICINREENNREYKVQIKGKCIGDTPIQV